MAIRLGPCRLDWRRQNEVLLALFSKLKQSNWILASERGRGARQTHGLEANRQPIEGCALIAIGSAFAAKRNRML